MILLTITTITILIMMCHSGVWRKAGVGRRASRSRALCFRCMSKTNNHDNNTKHINNNSTFRTISKQTTCFRRTSGPMSFVMRLKQTTCFRRMSGPVSFVLYIASMIVLFVYMKGRCNKSLSLLCLMLRS